MFKYFIIISFFAISQINTQWLVVGNLGYDVRDISVSDSVTIWAVGPNSISLSTNGGVNFATVQRPAGASIYVIAGINRTTSFVGDDNGNVWKTTDAGINWQFVISTGGNFGFINDIVFTGTNPSTGIIFSDPPTGEGGPFWIAKTTNGGNSWSIGSAPGVPYAIGTSYTGMCIDGSFYGFGLQYSSVAAPTTIKITTNGGVNWIDQNLGLGNSNPITTLAFNDNKLNGIGASLGGQNIARTTNTGANWMLTNVSMDGYACAKWITGTSICYISRYGSGIKKSTDNGNTWQTMINGGYNNIHGMDCIKSGNNIFGYAVNVTGHVLKLTDYLIGISKINDIVPQNYFLSQNYPNPFNPTTKIRFSVPINSRLHRNDNVVLKIYDALGHEVQTLVNEQLQPGTYEVDFDGSNFSSGIYYYTLKTDASASLSTGYFETKKMVLIK